MRDATLLEDSPTLSVSEVEVTFRRAALGVGGSRSIRAVAGVSLNVAPGEVLGIVGESGCGKSTLGRAALGLVRVSGGRVEVQGRDLAAIGGRELRRMRRHMQLVHQDPYSSFDPRRRLGYSLREGLNAHGIGDASERKNLVSSFIQAVGLDSSCADALPSQLSGGQLQRAAFARAYVLRPKLLVLDEVTASLDVSVKAQVVKLLGQLSDEHRTSMLFISHDLSVVHGLASRVAVMYLGRIVEVGPCDDVFGHPMHPYTQALVSAIPLPDPAVERKRERIVLTGEPPQAGLDVSGCAFVSRCQLHAHLGAPQRCLEEVPMLVTAGEATSVACHFSSTANLTTPGDPSPG